MEDEAHFDLAALVQGADQERLRFDVADCIRQPSSPTQRQRGRRSTHDGSSPRIVLHSSPSDVKKSTNG